LLSSQSTDGPMRLTGLLLL